MVALNMYRRCSVQRYSGFIYYVYVAKTHFLAHATVLAVCGVGRHCAMHSGACSTHSCGLLLSLIQFTSLIITCAHLVYT